MKKMVLLVIGTIIPLAFASCKEKDHDISCQYDMSYNPTTEQCECIQRLNSAEAPALMHDDYNTCIAVSQNFYYASLGNQDYPYYSHEGDTILCCGYAGHIYYAEGGAWAQFEFHDDSLPQNGYIWIESESAKLNSVDLSQKCFIKGTLSFGRNTNHFIWIGGPVAIDCWSPTILLNLTEIKN